MNAKKILARLLSLPPLLSPTPPLAPLSRNEGYNNFSNIKKKHSIKFIPG